MKAILIPVGLLILGSGAGAGAGLMLRPPATDASEPAPADAHGTEAAADAHAPAEDSHAAPADETHDAPAAVDDHGEPAALPYVALPGQFIVPIVEQAEVTAMVVLTLGLEVTAGSEESAKAQEPRLRAAFLQVLFDHANTGGFSGTFTASSNMRNLRHALLAAAEDVLGHVATEVLILDLLRQDV